MSQGRVRRTLNQFQSFQNNQLTLSQVQIPLYRETMKLLGYIPKPLKTSFGGVALEMGAHARLAASNIISSRTRPTKKFVIFGRGRSGSTLLVDMLDSHPDISCLGEIMRYPPIRPVQYAEAALGCADGNVVGFKLLSYQVRNLWFDSQRSNLRQWIVDNRVIVFRVQRSDLLRHAVSNLYAKHRRTFHSTDAKSSLHRPFHIDPNELIKWMEGSEGHLDFENSWLEDIEFENITYESDLANGVQQEATRNRLLDILELDRSEYSTKYKRVTPRCLQTLIENYDEVHRHLKGTKYEVFLPKGAED